MTTSAPAERALPDGARQRRVVLGLGLASMLVLVVGVGALIAGHVGALRRLPADASRIEELEARVRTDPRAAAELHAERERQTAVSLAAKERNRVVSWILLVAGSVFVGCGTWYTSRGPRRSPALEELVAARFPAAEPASPRRSDAPPAPTPPGEDGVDLAFVDELVARVGRSREAAIPLLQAIQRHYRYLPDEALQRVTELTDISPAQIAGTSSFYAAFRRSPTGRSVVRVCHGTACHVGGAERITEELRRHLQIPPGADTDPRRLFTIDRVACLGCCSLAPVMTVDEDAVGRLTPASARRALDDAACRT